MKFLRWLIGWAAFREALGLNTNLTDEEEEAVLSELFPNRQLRLF